MDTMQTQLNLDKLKDLIKRGLSSIPKEQSARQAIIVIGDTGVGKSTIMNFLAGNQLFVRVQGLKPKLVCQGPTNIKIGHDKYSQTSIPTRTIIQNLAFYDCPGFRDNKGEQYQISNSFFVQRLLDIYNKVKIVLMIDQSHISEARADKLPRLTKNLLRSFKSFNQIKQGVILIINRADHDLNTQSYCKQIRKMVKLKNEKGFLFGQQQQKFLSYLIDNNRIKLFKQPTKQDKDRQFRPTQHQLNIMPSIKKSDFVKSRHISNIVSQSAKIAIRDYIDNLTLRTNQKVQKIAADLTQKVIHRFNQAGKRIPILLQIKQQVMDLAQQIRSQNGVNILSIIKKELPFCDLADFQQDFQSIIFFKSIYDKTDTYFSNLINKTYSQLTQVLNKMDTRIIRYQKQQQEQLQRKQLILKRKQIQNQRDREKLESNKQLKEINDLRNQISQMGQSNRIMVQSLGDTLSFLNSLQQQFINLRNQAMKIKIVNRQLSDDFHNFQTLHLTKQPA